MNNPTKLNDSLLFDDGFILDENNRLFTEVDKDEEEDEKKEGNKYVAFYGCAVADICRFDISIVGLGNGCNKNFVCNE